MKEFGLMERGKDLAEVLKIGVIMLVNIRMVHIMDMEERLQITEQSKRANGRIRYSRARSEQREISFTLKYDDWGHSAYPDLQY